MMPFGISFDGFVPVAEAAETAKAAEACGASSFWVAEHLGFRETFITSLVLAQSTRNARVFPTSVSPYLRHPMPTTMTLATLAELMPGRFGIAIGVGNPLFLKESGLTIEKPVKAVREYVAAMRQLLSGEPVVLDGQTFSLNNARISFRPDDLPPIFCAPMGPQMLRLAGGIADGVVLSAGLTSSYARQSLSIADAGAQQAGRGAGALKKVSYIYFMAGGATAEREEKVRQKLAFLFRNQNIADNIRTSGLNIDQEAIMAAISRRDQAEAVSLVPREAVELFTIAGDSAECKRRAGEYLDAGVEELVFSLVGSPEDRMRSLEAIRTF
jgi:5,10-methylenetetrahydromethanopterin reductase